MKKIFILALFIGILSPMAYAETTKDVAQKTGNFWSREGERSGLKESTSSWGKFWENANPMNFFKNQQDAYNTRKGGMAGK